MDHDRQRIGSWTLPSGNSCDVYLSDADLWFKWDVAPSKAWTQEDIEHYKTVVYPAVLIEVARIRDETVALGVILG